jgi:hypothetical protein
MYVSGPMRGYPKFNFPVFDAVSAFLRHEGYEVDSPAEHDRECYSDIERWPGFLEGDTALCTKWFDLATALKWDLTRVSEDGGIVMLPGWERSEGARIERFVAECTGSLIYLATQCTARAWRITADVQRERMSVPVMKVAALAVEA